ncbi:MAG: ral stress protein [Actinomycetia bacterium]|nr:ral stress protein [Actinomycetes bacterium]
MTNSPDDRTLASLLDGLRIGMLGTVTPRPSSRPLTLAEVEHDTLRFLVSRDTNWIEALMIDPSVLVTFSSDEHGIYVAVAGRAELSSDRKLVQRLYIPAADVYFDGVDDPSIAVLEVYVESGEWWDGPSGRVGRALALAKAALTGDPDAVGDKGGVDVG